MRKLTRSSTTYKIERFDALLELLGQSSDSNEIFELEIRIDETIEHIIGPKITSHDHKSKRLLLKIINTGEAVLNFKTHKTTMLKLQNLKNIIDLY